MELRKTEYDEIKGLWTSWKGIKDGELEAVIRNVDNTEWMDILYRLRQLGLQEEAQIPYLDILLGNGMRFRMIGEESVQNYCKTNRLPESATCSTKSGIQGIQPVELTDYGVRIKLKRETVISRSDIKFQQVLMQWPVLPKSFRYIRRYSFSTPKGSGARFDLSIVRQSPKTALKQFAQVTTFQEPDILNRPLSYEVEIEAIREEAGEEPMPLISKIGQVLQGKQKSFVVLRRPIFEDVRTGLKAVFGQINKFPGPMAVTLEKKHLMTPTDATPDTLSLLALKGGYNVTDKADGLRSMLYVHTNGYLYLIDAHMNIYGTGLLADPNVWAGTVLDGEWIRQKKNGEACNRYYAFDIFRARGAKDTRPLPFLSTAITPETEVAPVEVESRFRLLQEAVQGLSVSPTPLKLPLNQQLTLSIKSFKAALPGSPIKQIFVEAGAMLDEAKSAEYTIDGLIFTPNALALPMNPGTWSAQFKWKPAEFNTIDFLVVIEQTKMDGVSIKSDAIITDNHPDTGELVSYKTLRLFVGGKRDPAFKDPRRTILDNLPLPGEDLDDYRPILFYPLEPSDSKASVCNVAIDDKGFEMDIADAVIRTTMDGQPISSDSIVEMAYNPMAAPGWRWIPLRIRWDKTEAYRRGVVSRTMNYEGTADSIWASIHDPVSENTIRTGEGVEEEIPLASVTDGQAPSNAGAGATNAAGTAAPEKVYVHRVDQHNEYKVKSLREFHNHIKNRILFGSVLQPGSALLDMGCGKGGDIHKWTGAKVGYVVGVDLAADSINNPRDGAYRRYLNKRIEFPAAPPMVFIQGNVTRPLKTGDAGLTAEDQLLLKSLFNSPLGGAQVPPFLQTTNLLAKGAEKFNVISCMFALHYFFQDRVSVDGFINNISDNLVQGGFFIGCCFDGSTVFNRLASLDNKGILVGKDGDTEIWNIEKGYEKLEEESVLPDTDAGLGHKINVSFITIGEKYPEYLVHYEYLKSRLAEVGIDVLSPEEMKALKLKESTGMFKGVHDRFKERFPLPDRLKEFSFFNRWFIFRRRSYGPLGAALSGEVEEGLPAPVQAELLPVPPPQMVDGSRRGGVTRGRGASTRGGPSLRGRGGLASPPSAAVPAPVQLSVPAAPSTTRGRGRGRGVARISFNM